MKKVRLGDIATVITKGTTPTTLGYNFVDDGVNFVKIESITENEEFLTDKFAHISDECNRKLSRSQLQRNDLLFSIAGAIGRTAIVTDDILPANTNQALAIIRVPEGEVDYSYLKYVLQSPAIVEQFEKKKQGVAQLNISLKDIGDFVIPLRTAEEQKSIVDTMDKVCGLIALRKEQLAKLDELVKARFVEMFGTYPANEKGWETGTIRDLVSEVRYGSSRKAADGDSGKYPYLRMNNITYSGELDLTDTKTIDIPDEELQKCTVRRGDVLFNRTNSKELVGKTCVYDRDEMMVLAGFVVRVRVNDRILPEILSAFLNTDFSKQMLLAMCKAAIGQANINAQELQNIGIYIPPIELQREFVTFKQQVDKSKLVIQESLAELETLKKALMQKYFG